MLFKNKVSALVIEKAGETSHAVIIAKSLGIPAVVGIDNICGLVRPGGKLIVDGKTGFIFSNPDEGLISEYETTYSKFVQLKEVMEEEGREPFGEEMLGIKLSANIGVPHRRSACKAVRDKRCGAFPHRVLVRPI